MPLSEQDRARARLAAGESVAFDYRRARLEGVLLRVNPKRAVVRVGADEYTVPHERITPLSDLAAAREERVAALHDLATELLLQHGLKKWTFAFDHSTRRAGCCQYATRVVSIAFDLAANGTPADARDTILHEIAHALVGPKHGHDAVWRAKVTEIGGSPARTHRLEFSPPRWTVSCENDCWSQTAQQRNPRLRCRACGGKLLYAPRHAG